MPSLLYRLCGSMKFLFRYSSEMHKLSWKIYGILILTSFLTQRREKPERDHALHKSLEPSLSSIFAIFDSLRFNGFSAPANGPESYVG
jgi:hypothetical protein